MAALAKKPQPLDLAALIQQAQTEAKAFVESKVMELKNSPSGQALPIDSLRVMLTRHDDCPCRVASRLLEKN